MAIANPAAQHGRRYVSRSQETACSSFPTPLPTCDLLPFPDRLDGAQPQLGLFPHCVQGSSKGFKGQPPHPPSGAHLL